MPVVKDKKQSIAAAKPVGKNILAVDKKIYRTYEDYDPEDLYTYAGIDCIVTSELASKLAPVCYSEPKYIKSIEGRKVETKAMSIFESYDKFTQPAFEFIIDMELNGIKYDVAGNRAMGARMVAEVEALEASIFAELGQVINLDSGDVMSNLLYVEKGFEVETRTKTGEPSTDGEALSALADKYELPWLRLISKRKDIVSIYRTFIQNYVEDFVKPDGRLHPSYNLHGTSSFRISGENPNLPQIPRKKHGYNIRDLFVPTPGYVFIALDFSSAEVKILAAISQDEMMLKAVREGLDFHSFAASLMKGVDYEDFIRVINDGPNKLTGYAGNPLWSEYKDLRQKAKILVFSILYGSTAGGIARQMGISLKEAQALMDLFFAKFPGIRTYIDNMQNEAKWNRYVVHSEFGQRKMQYGTLPCFENTAVFNAALRNSGNVMIQGPTSSLGLSAFAAANNEIKKLGARSLFTVYDSLELECPIEVAAEVLEIAFKYMQEWPVENFEFLTLPIGTEAELSGLSWGQVQVVHRGISQSEIEGILRKEGVLV